MVLWKVINENEKKGIYTEEQEVQNNCSQEEKCKLIPWIYWTPPPPFFFPQEAFVDHFPMSVANLEKHMHECIMVPVTKFFVYLFEYCCKCVLKCTHLFWENWIFCNKSTVRNIVESFKYCACAHAHTHTPYLSEYRHHSESKKSQQFASF